MDIIYNGLYDQSDAILTFSDVPNILKLYEDISGEKATFEFNFESGLRQTVTADSQYYVTFLGETVTNVMNPKDAKNKRFYISDYGDGTGASFARALRNCSSIAAEFNIICNGCTVALIAKTIGSKWNGNPISRNIPNEYLDTAGTDGNAYSVFFNSKISVDVYNGSIYDDTKYVTTLEKSWYGNECAFDMSPILATFSKYGRSEPYQLKIDMFREDGEWQHCGVVSGNTTIGYLANQSDKFKYLDGAQMLINKNRDMILYTYSNIIDYSVLCDDNTYGWNVTISCKDSANQEVWSGTTIGRRQDNNIVDNTQVIPESAFTLAYYVDITLNNDTTRFNVIKPLKATEYFQRVYWRNEYGGISFFDFTGQRSESDDVNIESYEKNIYDYYEQQNFFERKKIYDNKYKKTVSLTSHLMEEQGKYIFNSLMRSKHVWTYINGNRHYIIPKTIEVVEDQNYNGIYTAKLNYEYSDLS